MVRFTSIAGAFLAFFFLGTSFLGISSALDTSYVCFLDTPDGVEIRASIHPSPDVKNNLNQTLNFSNARCCSDPDLRCVPSRPLTVSFDNVVSLLEYPIRPTWMVVKNRLKPEFDYWNDIWFSLYEIGEPRLTQTFDLSLTSYSAGREVNAFTEHLSLDEGVTSLSRDKTSARLVTSPNLPIVPDDERIKPGRFLLMPESYGNKDGVQIKKGHPEYLVLDHDLFKSLDLDCFDEKSRFLAIVFPRHRQCVEAQSLDINLQPCNMFINDKVHDSDNDPTEFFLRSFGNLNKPPVSRDRSSVTFISSRPLLLHIFIPKLSTNKQAISVELQSRLPNQWTETAGLDTRSTNQRTETDGLETRSTNQRTDTAGLETRSTNQRTDAAGLDTRSTNQRTDTAGLETRSTEQTDPTNAKSKTKKTNTGVDTKFGGGGTNSAKHFTDKQRGYKRKHAEHLLSFLEEHGMSSAGSSVNSSGTIDRARPAESKDHLRKWFLSLCTGPDRLVNAFLETPLHKKMFVVACVLFAIDLVYAYMTSQRPRMLVFVVGDEYHCDHDVFLRMVHTISDMDAYDRNACHESKRTMVPRKSLSDTTISHVMLSTEEMGGDNSLHRCSSDSDIMLTQRRKSDLSQTVQKFSRPSNKIARTKRDGTKHLPSISLSDSNISHVTMSDVEEMRSDYSLYRCSSDSDVMLGRKRHHRDDNPGDLGSRYSTLFDDVVDVDRAHDVTMSPIVSCCNHLLENSENDETQFKQVIDTDHAPAVPTIVLRRSTVPLTMSELVLTTACLYSLVVPVSRKSRSEYDLNRQTTSDESYTRLVRCHSVHDVSMERYVLSRQEQSRDSKESNRPCKMRLLGNSFSDMNINHVMLAEKMMGYVYAARRCISDGDVTAKPKVNPRCALPVLPGAQNMNVHDHERRILPLVGDSTSDSNTGNHVTMERSLLHRRFSDSDVTLLQKPKVKTRHTVFRCVNQHDAQYVGDSNDVDGNTVNTANRPLTDNGNHPRGYPTVVPYDFSYHVSLNGDVVYTDQGTDVDNGRRHGVYEVEAVAQDQENADILDHHDNGLDYAHIKTIFWQLIIGYLDNHY